MALTLEQLSDLVETLQKKVVTLETEVTQYRQDILELEQQLSQSITTQKLVVQVDAQISGRDVLAIGQLLDTHEGKLNAHDGLLKTHESRLNSHDNSLSNYGDRLNSNLSVLNSHESRLNSHDSLLGNHDGRLSSILNNINSHEARLNAFAQSISIPGNLTVQGEIKGKLWFSNVFTLNVPNNGKTVSTKMLSANKCLALITSIGGHFGGGGERVWLEVRPDGFWYLCGHSNLLQVSVEARCVGMP